MDHKENNTNESTRAFPQTERSPTRLAELLPYGKYTSQTQGDRQLVAQQAQVLYLVRQLAEKKLDRKRKNLIRLGISYGQAYAWSRTRMGGWAVAQSPILRTTITLNRLRKRGYQSLSEHYAKVSPLLNEPPYTCLAGQAGDPYVRWWRLC